MAIEVRSLSINDLDEVMEIEPVAFGSHHWSHESFVNELSNVIGNYFGAFDTEDGKLVGYSGFWLVATGEEAHITTLAVHPDFRRHHIGERLLINDIVEARRCGARWMTLEVRMSNESAQQLYYKYGFKSLGVRRKYYQDNSEDALVLWTENIDSIEFGNLVVERVQAMKKYSHFVGLEEAEKYSEIERRDPNLKAETKLNYKSDPQAASRGGYKGADEC